jgi:signal transduction histidine kinase
MSFEFIEEKRDGELRALMLLRSCFKALVQNSSEKLLFEAICRIIVEEGSWNSAWIGIVSESKGKDVDVAASSGIKICASDCLKVSFAHDNKYGAGPCGKAIRTKRLQICEDISNSSEFEPWRRIIKRNLFKSSVSFPLLLGDSCLGALNVLSRSRAAFSDQELTVLREIADNLAFGIGALRAQKVVSSMRLFCESGCADRNKTEEAIDMHKQQLMQADKMASLGFLAAGLAHEINNPVNYIMLNASILKNAWDNALPVLSEYCEEKEVCIPGIRYPEIKDMIPSLLEGISEGADRIRDIVNGLKGYSRRDSALHIDESVNLNKVVESALSLLSGMIKKSTLDFKLDLDPEIEMVKGNFQRIEQVVINLAQNACQALPDPYREIAIRTGMEEGLAVLLVEDAGAGIQEKDLSHVYEPFFTTKNDSGGTGLGLAIVSGIVKDLKGDIQISPRSGGGTIVKVFFPVS